MKFLELKQVINKSGKFTKVNGFTISDAYQAGKRYTYFNILVRCKADRPTGHIDVEIGINKFSSNSKTKTHYYKGKVISNMDIYDNCLASNDILNAILEKAGLGKYNYTYDLHHNI